MTTAAIQVGHEQAAVPRYLNLAYRPEVFAHALEAWSHEPTDNRILVLILHPDELQARPQRHPLYAFDVCALGHNLDALERLARDSDCEFQSMTVSSLTTRLNAELP